MIFEGKNRDITRMEPVKEKRNGMDSGAARSDVVSFSSLRKSKFLSLYEDNFNYGACFCCFSSSQAVRHQ